MCLVKSIYIYIYIYMTKFFSNHIYRTKFFWQAKSLIICAYIKLIKTNRFHVLMILTLWEGAVAARGYYGSRHWNSGGLSASCSIPKFYNSSTIRPWGCLPLKSSFCMACDYVRPLRGIGRYVTYVIDVALGVGGYTSQR